MAFYKSKFTGEEIDQRLAQGAFDDAVKAGFIGTKEQFDQLLAKIQETTNAAEASQPAESDKLETVNKNIVDAINEIQVEINTKQPTGDYATKTELSKKVDKVEGKQLSTEDYTTAEKEKLAGLENYDDTNILNQLQQTETGVAENLTEIEKLQSGKQNIQDETLQTTDKTVVGAINNLLTKITELEAKVNELEQGGEITSEGYSNKELTDIVEGLNNTKRNINDNLAIYPASGYVKTNSNYKYVMLPISGSKILTNDYDNTAPAGNLARDLKAQGYNPIDSYAAISGGYKFNTTNNT